MTLESIRRDWKAKSVEMFGEDESRKLWAYAKDPITGYVSNHLNQVGALDGSIPCQRCGGFGYWSPPGSKRNDEVLCVRCVDDWSEVSSKLLRKHGYVSSKKKWHDAFVEFCGMKPEWKTGR